MLDVAFGQGVEDRYHFLSAGVASESESYSTGRQFQVVGQFELTHYPPETSAMKPATKRWISAGGRL